MNHYLPSLTIMKTLHESPHWWSMSQKTIFFNTKLIAWPFWDSHESPDGPWHHHSRSLFAFVIEKIQNVPTIFSDIPTTVDGQHFQTLQRGLCWTPAPPNLNVSARVLPKVTQCFVELGISCELGNRKKWDERHMQRLPVKTHCFLQFGIRLRIRE